MRRNYPWFLLAFLALGIGGGWLLYDSHSLDPVGQLSHAPSSEGPPPALETSPAPPPPPSPRPLLPLPSLQPPPPEDRRAYLLRRKEELLAAHQALLKRIPANSTERFIKSRKPEYVSLLESWGLSPSEIDQVYDVVFNRDKTISDLEFTIRADEAAHLMSSISAEAARQLEEILGKERTESLLAWEDSRRDRRILERFSSSLSTDAPALEAAQEQAVLDALYQVRKNLSENGRKLLSVMGDAYADKVIAQVSSLLTAPQQQKLREAIDKSLRR